MQHHVESKIEKMIVDHLNPVFYRIDNFSHLHAAPKHSETHFQITVVSDMFSQLNQVQRHRLVNSFVKDLISGPIHALTMHLYSPNEWNTLEDAQKKPQPPSCRNKKAADSEEKGSKIIKT